MLSYAGRNRRTVNYLKALQFDYPEWTPAKVDILPAAWMSRREALEEVVLSHPRLFPGFRRGWVNFDSPGAANDTYELGRRVDCWGVGWQNIHRGLAGYVEVEPLSDWSAFDGWKARLPDPLRDAEFSPRAGWDKVAEDMARRKARGDLAVWSPFMHGFFFMRLYYLRGFENLMVDLASDEPRLGELIALLTDHLATTVKRGLECGCEVLSLADDMGMQKSLPISPATWRRYVKAGYEATAGQARDRGLPVMLHSDGHILEIIPELIEAGVRLLNPQIGANGTDGLRDWAVGKVCLSVDLDRQMLPFASASRIDDHVGEVFEALHLPQGGLMLQAEIGPDVPLENVDALASAMERICRLPEA